MYMNAFYLKITFMRLHVFIHVVYYNKHTQDYCVGI